MLPIPKFRHNPNIIVSYMGETNIRPTMLIFGMGKIVDEVPPLCRYISGFGEPKFDEMDVEEL